MNRLLSIPMLACYVILMAGAPQVALSCDAKCEEKLAKAAAKLEKKIKKTAASYEKAIVKAETKDCKERRVISTAVKSCARSMKSIDKRYNKYKSNIKEHADIKSLKKRHDNLNYVLADFRKQVEINKLTNKLTQRIYEMESSCTTMGSQDHCLRAAEIVKKEYKSFPSNIQNSDDIKSKMKKYDELLAKNSQIQIKVEEKKSNLNASIAGASLYHQSKNKIFDVLAILKMGKNNKADDTLKRVEIANKYSSEIEIFKNNCKGAFTKVQSSKKDMIKEDCNLMANYDEFLENYKNNTATKYYNKELSRLSLSVNDLKVNGNMYRENFNMLMHGFDEYKDKFRDETSFIDLAMDKFDDIHDEFEDAIKIALKINDWDDVAGDEMHDDFEKSIEDYADRDGLEFKKGAYKKNISWKISKNGLGVPLHKYGFGYVLLEHSDESDLRMYDVTFYRDYQGGGKYDDGTSVNIKPYIMPVSD